MSSPGGARRQPRLRRTPTERRELPRPHRSPLAARQAKADAGLDEWLKDVAPSAELRRWYQHDVDKFTEFSPLPSRLRRQPASEGVEHFSTGPLQGLSSSPPPASRALGERSSTSISLAVPSACVAAAGVRRSGQAGRESTGSARETRRAHTDEITVTVRRDNRFGRIGRSSARILPTALRPRVDAVAVNARLPSRARLRGRVARRRGGGGRTRLNLGQT